MNILLLGYYGKKNIGDDIFLKQLIGYFCQRKTIKQIFIFCESNYYDIASNKVIFFETPRLSQAEKDEIVFKSDCIAWGGGSLNLESKPLDLLKLQARSQSMGKRFCFLGIGLESLDDREKEGIAEVFEKADLLYVRDNHSYELALQRLKSRHSPCLGGDLAFLNLSIYEAFINPSEKTKNSSKISNISFSGKFWWGEGRAEFYAQQLLPLIEKFNAVIHLLPAHVGELRNDNSFHERLKKYLPDGNCQLHSWDNIEDFLGIIGQMDFHIGNRLHSLIIADIMGVPNIGIGNHLKIKNYLKKINMLSKERFLMFMEDIAIERVEKIFQEYEKPKKFISQESKKCRECLEFFLK